MKACAEELAPSRALVDDFAGLLDDARAREFCRRVAGVRTGTGAFRKSWIGINFSTAGGLLGVKLYFTFYEPIGPRTLAAIVPQPGMRADFQAGMAAASRRHARDPALPGSGYTFCIKLDRTGEPTYGFYSRVGRGGSGIFRLHGGSVHRKEYFYVSGRQAKAALAGRFALPVAATCRTLEHGRGRGHGFSSHDQDEKLILIGDFARLRAAMFDPREAAAIAAVEARFALRACCGGVYRDGVKSFYLARPPRPAAAGGTRVSTIESVYRLLARRGARGAPAQGRAEAAPWR